MIDSHIHLDILAEHQTIDDLIMVMRQRNIVGAVIPATQPKEWQKQYQLAQQYGLGFSLGVHPWYVDNQWRQQIDALERQLDIVQTSADSQLLAIGECGLDGHHKDNFNAQRHSFDAQIQLAKHLKLPLIVHSVKAHEPMLKLLQQNKLPNTGVIHGFYGSVELAKRYIALGYKLGIGAILLNENANKLQQVIQQVPLDCLVIETDVAQVQLVKQTKNLPNDLQFELILPLLIKKIANLQKKSAVLVSEQVFRNTLQLFDL